MGYGPSNRERPPSPKLGPKSPFDKNVAPQKMGFRGNPGRGPLQTPCGERLCTKSDPKRGTNGPAKLENLRKSPTRASQERELLVTHRGDSNSPTNQRLKNSEKSGEQNLASERKVSQDPTKERNVPPKPAKRKAGKPGKQGSEYSPHPKTLEILKSLQKGGKPLSKGRRIGNFLNGRN